MRHSGLAQGAERSATGQPKTDKNNADAGKQSRPLIGVQIVLGMKPSGADQWDGNVYNANDGKTYTGSFTMTGANTAELKGCVMASSASRRPGRGRI